MKVLITGAGGQVGQALLNSIPANALATGLSHRDLDIANDDAVLKCALHHAPNVIINAAAYTAVDKAESELDSARRVNEDGPRNLARAAQELGARLIHLSTDFVFDGLSSTPYRPDAPTNPLSHYGRTKRAGEEAVLQNSACRSVILRTSWVYASSGSNFVKTMLRLMHANRSVRVVADQIGTPTSARSLASTLWKIVEQPDLQGIHHWTDAGVASWYDFAVAIAEEARHLDLLAEPVTVTPIATEDYPTPARRPRYSVLDKKSLGEIGIVPAHWREGLRAVLGDIKNA